MYLGLYLRKPSIKKGYFPKIETKFIKKYECGNIEDNLKIGQLFLDKINSECDIITASYEYDYWNSEQCKKILKWIENNQSLIIEMKLNDYFCIIENFCKKAVELDTGVEIDL